MRLLDDRGRPVTALTDLAALFGVSHDGTAAGLNVALQQVWYQAGRFRFQISPDTSEAERHRAAALFDDLGMCAEVLPPPTQFTYALLLGATRPAVVRRLAHLIRIARTGVSIGRLVTFASARVLDPAKEPIEKIIVPAPELPRNTRWTFLGFPPTTEAEMMRMTVEQTDLPDDWVRDAVCVEQPSATTEETLRAWIGRDPCPPSPGSCLVVSSNPFVGFQAAVVRRVLPPSFSVFACGPAALPETPIATFLDNIAKWLYEEVRTLGQ